jgi:hypothetical protein
VLDKINSNYFVKIMGYLPLSVGTNHIGESLPVYSFYNLLGVLGEIILAARNANKEDAEQEVKGVIVRNAQPSEYTLPSWALTLAVAEDHEAENEDEVHITKEKIELFPSEFVSKMVCWSRDIDEEIVVSPSVLAKVFTRYFYSTNSMDKDLPQESTLGEWMHRLVVVFLNSVLVVETTEMVSVISSKLNLRNPVTNDDIFIANLKTVNEHNDCSKSLKLSKWILSCPLWPIYLKDSFDFSPSFTDPENEFLRFQPNEGCKDIFNNSDWRGLYKCLDQIKVRSADSTATPAKKGKMPRKKNESVLPNFSVNNPEHLDYLRRIFKANGYTPDKIMVMNIVEITKVLKDDLSTKFNNKYVNQSTADAIGKRILDGTFTW